MSATVSELTDLVGGKWYLNVVLIYISIDMILCIFHVSFSALCVCRLLHFFSSLEFLGAFYMFEK